MRAWRNGRRACLRGMFERVWVRPPPPAPKKIIRPSNYFFVLLFFISSFFTLILVCGILSPAGHQTPVGARPRASRSRLWLKMTIQGHFLNASPREGNFMWVRPPPPAPERRKLKRGTFFFLFKFVSGSNGRNSEGNCSFTVQIILKEEIRKL